eukprot:g6580.t1
MLCVSADGDAHGDGKVTVVPYSEELSPQAHSDDELLGGAPETDPLDEWMVSAGVRVGGWHARQVACCALGVASEASEVMCIGYILPVLPAAFTQGSALSKSALSSAAFLGMLIGGCALGFASDSLGRRRCLLLSVGLNALFGIVAACAPNLTVLVACRFCAGIGVGGSVPVVFALARECVPPNQRGRYLVYVAAGWMCGSVFTAAMAWAVLGGDAGAAAPGAWRVLAAISAAPAFACFMLASLAVDESPRFLFARAYPALGGAATAPGAGGAGGAGG